MPGSKRSLVNLNDKLEITEYLINAKLLRDVACNYTFRQNATSNKKFATKFMNPYGIIKKGKF